MLRLLALFVLLWTSSVLADEITQSGVYDPLPFFESPKRVDATKPRYPKVALIHNICGEVRVAFSISSNGEITDKKIIYSDPPEIFDSEVVKFTDSWKFEQKFDNGIAIPYQTIVPIKFRQEGCPSSSSNEQLDLSRNKDFNFEIYKGALKKGCMDKGIRKGDDPEKTKDHCECVVKVLDNFGYKLWRQVIEALKLGQKERAAQIGAPYIQQLKNCPGEVSILREQ